MRSPSHESATRSASLYASAFTNHACAVNPSLRQYFPHIVHVRIPEGGLHRSCQSSRGRHRHRSLPPISNGGAGRPRFAILLQCIVRTLAILQSCLRVNYPLENLRAIVIIRSLGEECSPTRERFCSGRASERSETMKTHRRMPSR